MSLSEFILAEADQIVTEWAEFARTGVKVARGLNLDQRRDHIAEMLKEIAQDLETSQTSSEKDAKSKGKKDAAPESTKSAANSHGTDRAAIEAAIAPYRRDPFRWTQVEPTLEDVFIQLMEGAEDNFR